MLPAIIDADQTPSVVWIVSIYDVLQSALQYTLDVTCHDKAQEGPLYMSHFDAPGLSPTPSCRAFFHFLLRSPYFALFINALSAEVIVQTGRMTGSEADEGNALAAEFESCDAFFFLSLHLLRRPFRFPR